MGPVIGGILGGVAIIAIFVLAAAIMCRRRNNRGSPEPDIGLQSTASTRQSMKKQSIVTTSTSIGSPREKSFDPVHGAYSPRANLRPGSQHQQHQPQPSPQTDRFPSRSAHTPPPQLLFSELGTVSPASTRLESRRGPPSTRSGQESIALSIQKTPILSVSRPAQVRIPPVPSTTVDRSIVRDSHGIPILHDGQAIFEAG
jgi:hypothetical protein